MGYLIHINKRYIQLLRYITGRFDISAVRIIQGIAFLRLFHFSGIMTSVFTDTFV